MKLGPPDMAAKVKARLGDDIHLAFASPRIRIFLAEVEGKVVGTRARRCAHHRPHFSPARRQPLRLRRPDVRAPGVSRDRGIGSHMLRLCEDWFRDQGIAHSLLHAAPKAVRFYGREGYQANRVMFKRLI